MRAFDRAAWEAQVRRVFGKTGEQIIAIEDRVKKNDPQKHALLCIEEPENQLYPQLLQELAEEFHLYSNDGQVFISTHSPDFLNAVPLDSIYCLVKRDGFTTIKRAMENSTVKALVEAGDLPGTLWRENLLTEETL